MPEVQAVEVSMDDYVKARSAGEKPAEKQAAITPSEQIKTESEPATDNLESAEDKKSKGGGWQRRIDKLTKELNEERRARQVAEAKGTERTPTEQAKDKPVEQGQRSKPKSSDLKADGTPKYPDYDAFLEDYAAWRDEQLEEKFSGKLTEAQKKAQTDAENQKQEKVITEAFEKRTKAAQAKHDDFEETVFGEDSPISEGRIQSGSVIDGFILDPDNEGIEVLYHLCKNPGEIDRISKLSPQKQIRELGKIEDSILASNGTEEKHSPDQKKVNGLPPPIRPVATGTAKSAVKLSELGMDDYAKARKEGRTS